jgi:hypothetical protein
MLRLRSGVCDGIRDGIVGSGSVDADPPAGNGGMNF